MGYERCKSNRGMWSQSQSTTHGRMLAINHPLTFRANEVSHNLLDSGSELREDDDFGGLLTSGVTDEMLL